MKITSQHISHLLSSQPITVPQELESIPATISVSKNKHGELIAKARYKEKIQGINKNIALKAIRSKKDSSVTFKKSKGLKKLQEKVKKTDDKKELQLSLEALQKILKVIIANYKNLKNVQKN